jgi:uridine kinase
MNPAALPVRTRVERVIDWQRLRADALEPLRRSEPASFRPFNYALGYGLAEHAIRLEPTTVVILDGAYSCRPELSEIIDLKVLLTMPDDTARRQRLQRREDPAFLTSWHAIWDEAEDYYFGEARPESAFDVVIAAV